jgi:group I intron endonuclease
MQIYKITNLINKKIYIGKDEFSNENYYGSGKLIKKAIKKYGKENFIKEVLEDNINDKFILQEREVFWIATYNATDKKVGYNITNGGDGGDTISNNPERDTILNKIKTSLKGRVFSEDHLKKLRDNHNSKNPEVVKKIADKLRGQQKSEEHKKKLSESISQYYKNNGGNIRFKGDNNPMKKYKYAWYYDEQSGKCTRIKEGDSIPKGHKKGRIQISGLNNPMNKPK